MQLIIHLILISTFFLYNNLLFSQENTNLTKMNIAVIEFQVKGDENKEIGGTIADLLIENLLKSGEYSLKERISLDKLINEQKLGVSGLINEETAAQIGQFYGVKGIIIGNITKLGNKYLITSRLVDVETASILKSGSVEINNFGEITTKIKELSKHFTKENENLNKYESYSSIDYKKSLPLLNIFIPGIAQFQAGDNSFGIIFLTLSISGIGLIGLSEFNFMNSFNNYKNANNSSDAIKFYNESELWRNLSITGVGIFSGTIITSLIYTFLQPSLYALNGYNYLFAYDFSNNNFKLTFTGRF